MLHIKTWGSNYNGCKNWDHPKIKKKKTLNYSTTEKHGFISSENFNSQFPTEANRVLHWGGIIHFLCYNYCLLRHLIVIPAKQTSIRHARLAQSGHSVHTAQDRGGTTGTDTGTGSATSALGTGEGCQLGPPARARPRGSLQRAPEGRCPVPAACLPGAHTYAQNKPRTGAVRARVRCQWGPCQPGLGAGQVGCTIPPVIFSCFFFFNQMPRPKALL